MKRLFSVSIKPSLCGFLLIILFPANTALQAENSFGDKVKDAFEYVKDVAHLMTEKTEETATPAVDQKEEKKDEKASDKLVKKEQRPSELLRAVSFASGFIAPCCFAASSNIPLHKLGYYQLDRATQNCMLGVGSFIGLSFLHALVRATKLAYVLGEENQKAGNDKKKTIAEALSGSQKFINGEFGLARFLLEQMIHPVSIASCLGGGFKSSFALDMAHTILVSKLAGRQNRGVAQGLIKSHHTGILTGAFCGLMFKHRAVIGDSIGRVVSNAIKVSSRVLARG